MTERDERLERLIRSLSVVYDVKTNPLGGTGTTTMNSEAYELISSYGEKDSQNTGASGLATLCDEFVVQVGLDDQGYSVNPIFDVTKANYIWMEYLSPKISTAAAGGNQKWGQIGPPVDLAVALNNGYGMTQIFVPAARTVRFTFQYNMTTNSTPAGTVVMSVTGRIRNNALIKMLLEDVGGRLSRIEEMLAVYGNPSLQAVDRFARHVDPPSPMLFPSTMRR